MVRKSIAARLKVSLTRGNDGCLRVDASCRGAAHRAARAEAQKPRRGLSKTADTGHPGSLGQSSCQSFAAVGASWEIGATELGRPLLIAFQSSEMANCLQRAWRAGICCRAAVHCCLRLVRPQFQSWLLLKVDPFRRSKGTPLKGDDLKALGDATTKLLDQPQLGVGASEGWSNPVSGISGIVTAGKSVQRHGLACRVTDYYDHRSRQRAAAQSIANGARPRMAGKSADRAYGRRPRWR